MKITLGEGLGMELGGILFEGIQIFLPYEGNRKCINKRFMNTNAGHSTKLTNLLTYLRTCKRKTFVRRNDLFKLNVFTSNLGDSIHCT